MIFFLTTAKSEAVVQNDIVLFFFCLSAIPLSDDHKPNRRDERERIESAGGVVMWAGKYLGLTI